MLMYLTKAFDTVNHNLFLSKLDVLDFSKTCLKLMQQTQRRKFSK